MPGHLQFLVAQQVQDILQPVGQFPQMDQMEETTLPLDGVEYPEQGRQALGVVRSGFQNQHQFLGLG